MTLAEMESLLRRRVGSPLESNKAKEVLYEMLNLGYQDLCDRVHFRQRTKRLRFNTDADHNLYQIPEGWYEFTRLRCIDSDDRSWSLSKAAPRRTFDLDDNTSSGRPTEYALWSDEIQLYPFPDGVYTIEAVAKQKPPKLESPDDVPDIPVSWHMGIVMLARWYYYEGEVSDFAKASTAMQSFVAWMSGRSSEVGVEFSDLQYADVPTLAMRSTRRGLSPSDWRTGGM